MTPEPLTPPECDLRGMPYMPLDLTRLFDSDFYVLSTGDEFKAALSLWGKAFLQFPAGSLPDDDRILAHLSGAGRGWKKVRTMALRGFVKCSDGRLYHQVIAEKVLESWKSRLAHRSRTEAARTAKQDKKTVSNQRNTTSVTEVVTDSVTDSVTEPVTGSKGREGKGREDKKEPTPPPEISPEREARDARRREVCGVLGLPLDAKDWPRHWSGLMSKLDAWEADGADYRRHVLAACRDFAGKKLTATKGPAYLGAIIARLQAEAPAVRTTSVSAGPDPRAPESDFKAMRRLECHAKGEWYDAWGPPPGMAGCLIPDRIFAEFDARKAA